MSAGTNRRAFLAAAMGGLAGVSLGASRSALAGDRAPLGVTRLTDTLFIVTGAGGNVLAATGDAADGVLLVDGGLAEHSKALLRLIARETGGRKVRTLFNTHWHWDHTGSNEALAREGATIIAHENTKLWLGAEIIVDWQQRTYPPRPAAALPARTFVYTPGELTFGGQTVRYGYLPQAHTDGDIYVHFPRENVIAVGDVVSSRYPLPDYCTGGWIGGLVESTRRLLSLTDERTRIVPGSGAILSRADLQAQLEVCEKVLERVGNTYRKALNFDNLLAEQPTQAFDARFGDPALFLRLTYRGARGHERDMGGIF